MNDNARGHLLQHKSNGVYTPTTQPLVSSVVEVCECETWICRSSISLMSIDIFKSNMMTDQSRMLDKMT